MVDGGTTLTRPPAAATLSHLARASRRGDKGEGYKTRCDGAPEGGVGATGRARSRGPEEEAGRPAARTRSRPGNQGRFPNTGRVVGFARAAAARPCGR